MSAPIEFSRRVEQSNQMQEVRFNLRDGIGIVADYRKGGNRTKSVILNLHGLMCSKEMAKGAFGNLDLNEFTILNLDLPGSGKSPKLEESQSNLGYSMAEQADVVLQVLEQVGYDEVIIVPHSMSGAIATYLAEKLLEANKRTDNKKKIVFRSLEGTIIPEDCGPLSRDMVNASLEEIKTKKLQLTDELRLSDSPGERQWAEEIAKADPEVAKQSSTSLVEEADSENLLPRLVALRDAGVDVAYMYGEISDMWAKNREELEKSFKTNNIPLICVPGVGHFLQDKPIVWTELARSIK